MDRQARPRLYPCSRGTHDRHSARLLARRQVHAGRGARLPERDPGARAAPPRPAPRRRAPRPPHGHLHLGLPRVAPGWPRPDARAQPEAPGRAPRGLLLRAQRGPRRHRRLREPDGRLVPAAPLRRRARHVVRQGPRGGPHRRRVQARELRRGGAERRRARPVRRRPHLQVVDLAEPLRGRALRRLHADDLSRQRAGDPRPRTPRLHAVPALRALGGRQDRHQRGRRDGDRRGLARTHPADRPHPGARRQTLAAPDQREPDPALRARDGAHPPRTRGSRWPGATRTRTG